MRWYERYVTEARWFKRASDPATRHGAKVTAGVALVLAGVALVQNPDTTRDCQTNPLRGVYNPHRLEVVAKCVKVDVRVTHVVKERDGDLHIQAAARAAWVNAANRKSQKGRLVVEFMRGDPWPRPRVGDRLRLTCTKVRDRQHGGWVECHPVWAVEALGATAARVVP